MDQRSRDFVRGRLADPAWLVRANPKLVIVSLESAADRTQLLAAAVYRASAHLHQDSSAAVRRQVLSLDAARIGERALAARISEVSVDEEPAALWRVRWVGGPQSDPRSVRAASGRTGEVLAVTSATSAGRKVVISGIDDGTVRLWDLLSGKPVGEPLVGHGECVLAVAGTVRDERLVTVTGGGDGRVRIWDLRTLDQIGPDLVFPSAVRTLATAPGDRLVVGFDREVAVLEPR